MKIKLHRNPGVKQFGPCPLKEGDEGEVSDALGADLCDAGLADCLDAPPEIKAVPPAPAIAEAKPSKPAIKTTGKSETKSTAKPADTSTKKDK